jgi:hypothetical protein
LLIDHGRFACGWLILFFICALNTIAGKPEHDKATHGMPGLNCGAGIAIVIYAFSRTRHSAAKKRRVLR